MIQEYNAKPSFAFRGESSSNLFLGIELEVEPRKEYSCQNLANKIVDCLGNFVITKSDSSVPHGFEICSSPASLEYHEKAWDKFFEDIVPQLRGFKTHSCGMHVHISRSPLSLLQIGKILIFIYNPENYKFIRRIAQRDSEYHNNFQEKRTLSDAKPEKNMNYDKHTAVNLRYQNTVEIRLFKANLRKDMFLKNVEFCHALAKFTWPGAFPLSEVKEWKFFALFIKENKKKYPNLYKFLVEYHYISDKRLREVIEKEKAKEIMEAKELERKEGIDFEALLKRKAKKVFDFEEIDWKMGQGYAFEINAEKNAETKRKAHLLAKLDKKITHINDGI